MFEESLVDYTVGNMEKDVIKLKKNNAYTTLENVIFDVFIIG